MKILITGGHYTPAMAVIDHLKNHEVVFVGRKYSIESELTESPEFKEINLKGIKFNIVEKILEEEVNGVLFKFGHIIFQQY